MVAGGVVSDVVVEIGLVMVAGEVVAAVREVVVAPMMLESMMVVVFIVVVAMAASRLVLAIVSTAVSFIARAPVHTWGGTASSARRQ